MVSFKKLVQMAKKWQRMTALGRRRITSVNKISNVDTIKGGRTPMTEKGHFVIYSIDGKRFMIPLVYLSSRIIERLFTLSENEFGYTVDGPITLPWDGVFMEYVVDSVKKGVSKEMESALLSSLMLLCPYVPCSMQTREVHMRPVEVCSF